MNWLLIVVGIFIIGNMIWGYWKGFLHVVFSLVEWVLVMALVTFASPYVSGLLQNHTNIPAKIEVKCMEKLMETIPDTLPDTLPDDLQEITPELKELISKENIQDVLGAEIPDVLMDRIMAEVETIEIDKLLDTNDICQSLAHKLAEFATMGIAYLLTLIIASILVGVLGILLDIVSKLPILSGANKIAGIAAGFIKGMLLVWIAFAILSFCAATPIGATLISHINSSAILTWLYEKNLIMTILLSFL